MLFQRELADSYYVCRHCNYHIRIDAKTRLSLLFDQQKYQSIGVAEGIADPLNFRDLKKYTDRLKEARSRTNEKDVVQIGYGRIEKQPAVVAAFDFNFMGGSMGTAVGDALIKAAQTALNNHAAFIVIPSSGGARMQEGILSLMQMPRTTIAVRQVKEAGLPYITVLTDPTTGGVSASFAMLGDVAIAEPGATIGFAGTRVIQETIREKLPEGFQKAEYLLEHGIVDMVVSRPQLKATLGLILKHLSESSRKGRS